MQIAMLGPLEVRDDDGAAVPVAGIRLRTLLIALALTPRQLIPTSRLIDAVWGDGPPPGAANALQALVSRLRRALPAGSIESHPAGYRLVTGSDDVDIVRFERLVAAGRTELARDPAPAAETLRDALGLWRGPALLDVFDQEFFQATITRLDELRLTAIEDRVGAELRLGRGADLVTELTALAVEHPLRERLVAALMRAMSEAGSPAEALGLFERTREALADRLGTDPSPELSAVHTAVLRGEIVPAPAPGPEAAHRTNMPTGLTSFVGRDADVVKVRELLGDYRLTTLIGPGGAGKTRLAVEASRTLLDQMPDGVWLVEFDRVTEPADLPAAVLAALGLREQSLMGASGDPIDRLTAALRDRAALLVLDNCEHVITAAATLADRVLADCPRLRILATSREPLNINGESVWPVEPLALPAADVELGVAELMSYDAVRLLVDRVRAVRPGFDITDDAVPAVSAICRALDGMPLAIELAAARLRTMTVVQLASRLDDRFRLLTGGNRTAMTRHQTLRAVVDWSWELLSDAERALLRRVTVFAGGVTVEAAERVCAGGPVQTSEVLDLLTALADKSLLMAEGDDEAPRYRMLETIRAYGRERLDEAGELDAVRQAYARFFVELAETAEPHLRRAEQLEWGRRLEAEHDNLHAAMRSAIALGDAQLAVRMVNAAGWYWWFGGHKAEGIQLATEALELPGEVDAATRATGAAMIAYFITAGLGDLRQAEPWIREAQSLAKELADPGPLLRLAVAVFPAVPDERGPGMSAMEAMEPLLADDDPWVRAQIRLARTRMLGDEERETDIEQALDEFRSIGERWGISYALATMGDLAARRGDLPLALDYCRQAAQVLTEMGAREDLVFLRAREAQLHWLLGDPARSGAAMAQAERDAEHVAWADAHAAVAFFKGDLARWSGDLGTARTELGRVDAALPRVKADPLFRSMILDSLAYVDAIEGDLARAGDRRAEALAIALGGGDLALVSQVLVGVADQAVRRGYPHEAARLLAAAERVGGGPDRSRPDEPRVAAAGRAAVGDAKFSEALQRARDGFSGLGRGELANSEEVRELTASVLSAPAPKAG